MLRKKMLVSHSVISRSDGLLSQVDVARNKLAMGEKELRDLSEKMLVGAACKFGKDSDEYEKAGGTRKSERRRPAAKAKV